MHFHHKYIKKIQEELTKTDEKTLKEYSGEIISYFNFFSLSFIDTEHIFNSFKSLDKNIVYHIFKKDKKAITIIIIHGFLEHSGLNSKIIRFLLEKGFNVAVFDLPGHGLSSGARGHINTFSEYASVLNDFIKICNKHLSTEYDILGHSTGCSVIIEYLSNYKNIFRNITMAAPLIRSYLWNLSMTVFFIFGKIIKSLPRRYSGTSTNKCFINFMKTEPLNIKLIPTSWIFALKKWNKQIQYYSKLDLSVNIIQGKRDTVVDYKYNIKYIKNHFTDVNVNYIPTGKHSLFNEIPDINKQILSCLDRFFH